MKILYWENKKQTALYFLSGNMLFITLIYYNIFTVSLLFAFFLCSLGIFNIGFEFLKNSRSSKLEGSSYDYEYVSKETIEKFILTIYSTFFNVRQTYYDAVSKGNYKLILYTLVCLFLINLLSSLTCDLCALWICFVLPFGLPKLYQTKSDKILATIEKLESLADKILNKALAKVPKFSDLK